MANELKKPFGRNCKSYDIRERLTLDEKKGRIKGTGNDIRSGLHVYTDASGGGYEKKLKNCAS